MAFLSFSVDSALLRELGEKLVETVHIALVELVKNCYDADATKVEVIFTIDESGKSQIKVVDNGKGMNFAAVQNYWMRIATTNKADADVSAVYGRPLTGAKGIGRFSCRRLGGHLRLITNGTSSGNLVGLQENVEHTEVNFPWSDFLPGTDVTEIECPGTQEILPAASTGTTLIISEIAEEWHNRGLNWLKRQLAVLAANNGAKRKGFEDDPGFNVILNTPDFEGGVRDLRDDLMNAGWGTLTAFINSKHQAVCELNGLVIGRKTIVSSAVFPLLNDISLKLAIMVDDRSQMRDTTVLSQGTLQKILPEWGGVQIRYRNFRVTPYGDDDWLDIDHDRGLRRGSPKDELFSFASTLRGVDPSRALLNLLSMRSYVGNVNIGESAEGFEMKSNREGFISSSSVDQLKEFVRFAIDWATVVRDFSIRQQSQEDSLVARKELELVLNDKFEAGRVIDAAVNYLENEVQTITRSLAPEERREVESSFLKATDAIRKHDASNRAELLHLRLVASTSTLLLIFSHEVRSLLGLLEQSKNELIAIAETLQPKQKQAVDQISTSFINLKDRLEELLDLTSLVGIDHKKSVPTQVALKEKIIRVENVFSLIVSKYQIEIDHTDVPNNIVIKKILEAELYSILLNILSNSIKSVIAAGKNRKIKISSFRGDGKNIIHFRDTGMGLDPAKYEEVFIPFISDPEGQLYQNLDSRLNSEDRLIIGSGSGLGLGIVKEIVNAHDGKIGFLQPEEGWKAKLEVRLP